MNPESDSNPELLKKFDLLRTVPARSPDAEKAGRAAFLKEAQELAGRVTPLAKPRHNGWMHALQSIFQVHKKEHSPMFSTLATIILIATLILGGGGATVAAAQNSQPDQPLYSLKIFSEEIRLGFSVDPKAEYQLALEFADQRAAEIQTMLQAGSLPPAQVQIRYQNQVEQAIQFALNLSDDQTVLALDQIRTHLQTQQQSFLQVQANASPRIEAALIQTRQMLEEHQQVVAAGLAAPAKLREQLRLRNQSLKQTPLSSLTPIGQSTQVAPGTGSGNPWTTGTPTPGSAYGPGKSTAVCEICTPTGAGQGSNPWTTGTPTPGSGYGPGPGHEPTQTCTPGTGNGPQATQIQGNQPTQAGPQDTKPQNNQPTLTGTQPNQNQKNQPTQTGPQPTQSTPSGSGMQATPNSGGQGRRP